MKTLSKYQINPTEVKEVSLGDPIILTQSALDKIMQQDQIFFTSSNNLKNIGCVGAYVSPEYGNTWVIVNKCSKPISFNIVLRYNGGYTASFNQKCAPAHALYTTGYLYSWQLLSMTDGEPQC